MRPRLFVLLVSLVVATQSLAQEQETVKPVRDQFYPEWTQLDIDTALKFKEIVRDAQPKSEVGRYQLVGKFRLDTVTGEILHIDQVLQNQYQRHRRSEGVDVHVKIKCFNNHLHTVRIPYADEVNNPKDAELVIDISEAISELFGRLIGEKEEGEVVPVSTDIH